MEKIFYRVQLVKHEYVCRKTYSERVTDIVDFEEEDFNKAVALWRKSVHNDIIRHAVTYLDKAPYYIDETIFGERKYVDDENGDVRKALVFENKDKVEVQRRYLSR